MDDKLIDFNLKLKGEDIAKALTDGLTFDGETYHDNETVELLRANTDVMADIFSKYYELAKSVSKPGETRFSAREISYQLDWLMKVIVEDAEDVKSEIKRWEEK